MGLLLVRPFLADKALIVISHSNWEAVRQSSWDFVAVNPQAKLLLELPAPSYGDSKFWNGLQVFSWDIEEAGNCSWSAFQEVRNQSVIQAIYNLQSPSREKIAETIYKEALDLDVSEALAAGLAAGKIYSDEFLQKVRKDLIKAEEKYKLVLQWDKENVEVWLKLGRLYYVLEEYQESLEVLLKSLEIEPAVAIQHYSLGLVLEKIGEISQAIRAYQEAIALQPNLIDAYNNLGNILVAAGEMERAESVYRQAIAANPDHFGSYLNLGNVLMARGDVDAGIAAYETALKLSPNNPDILNNLGVALQAKTDDTRASLYLGHAFYHQGRYEEAISEYQKFLASQTGDVNFYISLAECYNRLHRYEETIKVYREGIRLYPATANLYSGLVSGLQECGRTREAIEVAAEACRLFPDDLEFRLKKFLTLPILYESQEEIDFYRRQFSQGLEELIQTTPLDTPEAINEALRATGRPRNLYLQYQGYNDLEFQKQYGQFVHRLVAAKYPEWVDKRAMPPLSKDGKIRIGYISNCLQYDVAGDLLIGWLRNCDQQNFEVYCYYLDSKIDQSTLHYRTCCDKFYHIPNGLEAVSRQILADQLHILVFPDIGRYALITQIAALRLAPVQCTTWAHPITSGLPTIDYFLSSDLMEPENAQEHYSEQLIRLPNIAFSYAKPDIPAPTKTRLYFQLRDKAVVYLSCQFISKYLPLQYISFPEIAQRVPTAQFAFIAHKIPQLNEQFQQRLQRAFAKVGLNSEDYCVIVPQQTNTDFLNLMLASDIFLDTFSWSGGHTTLEAVACNLPVVTCPGEFMRGRHSWGILQMLGVTETVAKNEAEYIEIAVRLGLDRQWRDSISQRIAQRHSCLYDDKACVEALEAFYRRVVEGSAPASA